MRKIILFFLMFLFCYYIFIFIVSLLIPYHYTNITKDLLGKDIDSIDSEINIQRIIDFKIKNFVGYPYKTYSDGCGKAYSLTIYYDNNRKVNTIVNKVSIMCNDREYISKRRIISNDETYTEIKFFPILGVSF